METPTGGWTDQEVEQVVGNLLRIGVITAAMVVLAGGIMYLVRHGGEVTDLRIFHGEPADLRSPVGIVEDVFDGRRRAIIQFGLLVLIATPVARVVFSVYAFVRQRDSLYVVVTLIVLAVLLYSLFNVSVR
jgi:uncharacterized membrane protein